MDRLMSQRLHISRNTIQDHLKTILDKVRKRRRGRAAVGCDNAAIEARMADTARERYRGCFVRDLLNAASLGVLDHSPV